MPSKKIILTAAVVVLGAIWMAAMTATPSAKADEQNSLGRDAIVGSWRVTVSFDDGRPNVLALYTFDRDRNFTMDGSWPGLFGPGNGSWNRNREDANVNLTFFRLLYSPSESNEASGALNATFNGTLKVQARLIVGDDDQSFTGRYLLTNFDPTGAVRSTATGNLTATRVVVEPLL